MLKFPSFSKCVTPVAHDLKKSNIFLYFKEMKSTTFSRQASSEGSLEQIGNIEKRLWGSADTLRANSNFASNEYFMPVMGLIFLRHSYSRFLKVRDELIPTLPSRGGKTRELTKEDFSRRGSIYLHPQAEFNTLVSLPEGQSASLALIAAMESIEEDYETLKGLLPKQEYAELGFAVIEV